MQSPFRFVLFPSLLLFLSLLPAQEAVDILSREILKTIEERDRARKELLQVESNSKTAIQSLSREKSDLNQTLEQRSKEIMELETSAAMSAAAAERARAELEIKTRDIQLLKAEQTQMQQQYQTVIKELEGDTIDPEDATWQRYQLRQQKERLREQLNQAQEKITKMESSRSEISQDQQALNQLNQELQSALNQAQRAESLSNAKLAALESRLGSLTEELKNQYEERSRLEQEKADLEDQVKQLQSDLARAETERVPREIVDALQVRLDQALAVNRSLREELQAAGDLPTVRQDLAMAKKERDILSAQQKSLNSTLDRTQKSLESERKDAQELSKQNRDLQNRLQAEMDRRKELEKDIRALEAGLRAAEDAGVSPEDLVEVQRVLEDMVEENTELKTIVENQKNTVDFMVAELDETEKSRTRELNNLQTLLGDRIQELTEAKQQINHLERRSNELDFVREEKGKLEARQVKTQNDLKILATHIYELRKQITVGREANSSLIRERERSRELDLTVAEQRRELSNMSLQQAKLEKERHIRDAQIKAMQEQLRLQNTERERMIKELEALKALDAE